MLTIAILNQADIFAYVVTYSPSDYRKKAYGGNIIYDLMDTWEEVIVE